MPTQSVTIEIEVPEGYEATGEYRSVGRDEYYVDAYCSVQRGDTRAPWPILRRKPDKVAEWIAEHPWLPERCWVYRYGEMYYASRHRPDHVVCGYTAQASIGMGTLADLHGEGYRPPPVDCLQVTRPAAQGGEA